jgi:hypothetical protein
MTDELKQVRIDAGSQQIIREQELGIIQQVNPALEEQRYAFKVDSFLISNTRAAHEDTDYVTISVRIGDQAPISSTKFMGNVNNGTHQVNLQVGPFVVEPHEKVILRYLLVNRGHGSDHSSATAATLSAAASEVPVVGDFAAAIGGIISGLLDLVDCDGIVAKEQLTYTSAEVYQRTELGGGTFTHTSHSAGTDSDIGCGSNSQYDVTWSITHIR